MHALNTRQMAEVTRGELFKFARARDARRTRSCFQARARRTRRAGRDSLGRCIIVAHDISLTARTHFLEGPGNVARGSFVGGPVAGCAARARCGHSSRPLRGLPGAHTVALIAPHTPPRRQSHATVYRPLERPARLPTKLLRLPVPSNILTHLASLIEKVGARRYSGTHDEHSSGQQRRGI